MVKGVVLAWVREMMIHSNKVYSFVVSDPDEFNVSLHNGRKRCLETSLLAFIIFGEHF